MLEEAETMAHALSNAVHDNCDWQGGKASGMSLVADELRRMGEGKEQPQSALVRIHLTPPEGKAGIEVDPHGQQWPGKDGG